MIRRFALAALVLTFAALPAAAQAPIPSKKVQFPRGATGTTLQGTLKGDGTMDYKLAAAAGQRMALKMTADNASAYFNVMGPGSQGEAFFIGATSGNSFEGTLEKSGEQTIRVYLMRNAARRGEAVHYKLEVSVTGAAR